MNIEAQENSVIETQPIPEPVKLAESTPLQIAAEILVVGPEKFADTVSRTLEQVGAAVRWFPNLFEANVAADRHTRAFVLLEGGEVQHLPAAVAHARSKVLPTLVPVFVVAREHMTDTRARRIYARGASAVFQWPSEAFILPKVVCEMIEPPMTPIERDPDRALERVAEVRLRIAERVGDEISVDVDAGKATLTGNVRSMEERRRAEGIMLGTMPGLSRVDTDNLKVEGRPSPSAGCDLHDIGFSNAYDTHELDPSLRKLC